MSAEMHAHMANDLLSRSRVGLGAALQRDLPMEEQAHGAAVALAMATAAHAHATLATLPEALAALQERADVADEALRRVHGVVVGHVAEALVSHIPEVRQLALSIASELDVVGHNIDRDVDERCDDLGAGPHLWDHDGVRYDLRKQFMDQRGKRWEHSGDWTLGVVPVLRRDDKPQRRMPLDELSTGRGPLMQVVATRSKRGFSDEPPF